MRILGLVLPMIAILASTATAGAQDRDRRDDRDRRGDRYRRPHVTVFADDDFRGRRLEIDGPIARLGPTGMEDKISSIGIDSGAWEVCTDDDFRGRCEIIDRSNSRLNRVGLEDNISSIRPAPPRRWRR